MFRSIATAFCLALAPLGCHGTLGLTGWGSSHQAGTCENCSHGKPCGECNECTPCWTPFEKYCSPVDDLVVVKTARHCAKRDLKQVCDNSDFAPSAHFADGFEQAYVDIAMGASGAIPVVPPQRYWSAYYRSPAGRVKAEEWFSGYGVGAEMALSGAASEFREIATSGMYGSSFAPIAGAPVMSGAPVMPGPPPAMSPAPPLPPSPAPWTPPSAQQAPQTPSPARPHLPPSGYDSHPYDPQPQNPPGVAVPPQWNPPPSAAPPRTPAPSPAAPGHTAPNSTLPAPSEPALPAPFLPGPTSGVRTGPGHVRPQGSRAT